MTGMVARLERQGLVERRRDPSDGRVVLVAITGAGRDMLRRRGTGRVAFLSSLIGALDPAEQRALGNAAAALRHMTDPTAVPAALAAAKHAVDQHVEKGGEAVGRGVLDRVERQFLPGQVTVCGP
jgi:DNA-binding PadR family transcriptional regulator